VTCEQTETPKTKVLRVITRLNVGGPALHVLLLSEGLEGRGYETVLVAGSCEEYEGDALAEIPRDRVVISQDRLSRSISPGKDIAALWSLYRLIRRERPAIVHTHTAKAGLIGRIAAFAAGVPLIVHTFHGNSLSGYFSPSASRVFRLIEQALGCITSRICVVSNSQLDELSGKFGIGPRDKFRVIPLGLDLSNELRQPLPEMNDGILKVGWLGRLVKIKGLPLLSAIIEEAARRELPVTFLLGGDGPERSWIQDAIARFGSARIGWTGWRRDVNAFLAECHLLVQTSRNEGTPLALIQGMAAGRPFISTPAGGVVDMVCGAPWRNQDGCRWYANGVLAEFDPAAFVNALSEYVRDAGWLPRMGLAAREFAAKNYQAERLIRDVDRLYQELLAEQPAASPQYAVLQKLTGESK
jgi:glycosyltransferase involved in cell wall biosynthesis